MCMCRLNSTSVLQAPELGEASRPGAFACFEACLRVPAQANEEKLRLETKQRAARKAAERGEPIRPRWFTAVPGAPPVAYSGLHQDGVKGRCLTSPHA